VHPATHLTPGPDLIPILCQPGNGSVTLRY